MPTHLPSELAACPACGYSLRGRAAAGEPHSEGLKCPECGQDLGDASLACWRRRQRRHRLLRVLLILAVVYGPFCTWVFFEDYPWDQYRWHWVRLLPLMPTILPGDLLARLAGPTGGTWRLVVAAVLLLALGLPILWHSTRSWWRCGVTAAVLLPLMSCMAWVVRNLMLA